jgi:hypothetical protein
MSTRADEIIVFNIYAMDNPTVAAVKKELRIRANEIVDTFEIKDEAIERLSTQAFESVRRIQSLYVTDVTIEIGK